jgi:hypothetical protein
MCLPVRATVAVDDMTQPEQDALKELLVAGGTKGWVTCRFTFMTADALATAGLIEYERDKPLCEAAVKLTDAGRAAALREPSSPLWRTALICLFGPTLLVLPLEIIYFIGSVRSVGIYAALDQWETFLFWPGFLTGGLFGLLLVAFVGAWVKELLVEAKVKEKWPRLSKAPRVIGKMISVLVCSAFVWMIYEMGWSDAREAHVPVENADKTLAEGKEAISKQHATINNLSDSAHDLLAGLDKTGAELARAKEQITGTLTQLSMQQQAVDEANRGLDDLLKKQQDLRFQQQEIDRVFHDRYIPTRGEISHGFYVQTGIGIILGVVTSLLATWIWERLKFRLRRAPSLTSQPTSAHDPLG